MICFSSLTTILMIFLLLCLPSSSSETENQILLLFSSFVNNFEHLLSTTTSQNLHALAVKKYIDYVKTTPHVATNNGFYIHQTPASNVPQNPLFDSSSSSSSPFHILKQATLDSFNTTLTQLFNKPLPNRDLTDALFCWASVHPFSSFLGHQPHTHSDSVLSSVYYPSAGTCIDDDDETCSSSTLETCLAKKTLTLMDPRGQLTPFGGKYVHRPRGNGLIVFPSWLVHYVGSDEEDSGGENQSCKEGYRVSYSCNLAGQWLETTDLNLLI